MEEALKRIQEWGMNIETVIDVGASDGRWSILASKSLPDAHSSWWKLKKCIANHLRI